jgi:hypothetical protein
MIAASITLDQIESRTAVNLALASYVRRIRDGIVSNVIGNVLLSLLIHRLEKLKSPLQSGFLDKLSDEQLKEFSGLLKQLICALVRVTESDSAKSRVIHEYIEDFESILENIHLALDPGFHKAVSLAIEKLDAGVNERADMLPR